MIAASGWLVWQRAGLAGAALPLAVYAVQLTLNAAWTPLFFGLHRPGLGFSGYCAGVAVIVATSAPFHPIHAGAAFCSYPTWHGSPLPQCSTSPSGVSIARQPRKTDQADALHFWRNRPIRRTSTPERANSHPLDGGRPRRSVVTVQLAVCRIPQKLARPKTG